MRYDLVASGDQGDTLKALLEIQRKEAIKKRLREFRRSVILKCHRCGTTSCLTIQSTMLTTLFVIDVEGTFGMIQ